MLKQISVGNPLILETFCACLFLKENYTNKKLLYQLLPSLVGLNLSIPLKLRL